MCVERRAWSGVSYLSLSVTLLVAAAPARAGIEVIDAPIVDGRLAGAAELYATVSIVDVATGDSDCTGTLIAPRVVVTAAHCLAIEDEASGEMTGVTAPGELEVVAGALDVSAATSDETHAVERVVVHEGYPNESVPVDPASGAGRYDDIGLLILADDVTGLTPALVPSLDEAVAALTPGRAVTVSGYGATSATTDETGVLYIADLDFVLRADAELVLGGPGEPDTCPGDSGGPAYLLDGGAVRLVGATSRASESAQAQCGDGGIYTFVPSYRSWIVDHADGLYTADTPTDPGTSDDPGTPNDPGDGATTQDDGGGCAGGGPGGLVALFASALVGAAMGRSSRG